jgi:hypothetical protein
MYEVVFLLLCSTGSTCTEIESIQDQWGNVVHGGAVDEFRSIGTVTTCSSRLSISVI